ncbi:hypothetical protein, partial [Crocosphaera watsonii]|uniref:hypothetical protein n=1 Tax=Crocosphaera watsonii TaxID=263511 RepID=UPI0006617E8F
KYSGLKLKHFSLDFCPIYRTHLVSLVKYSRLGFFTKISVGGKPRRIVGLEFKLQPKTLIKKAS